MSSLKQSAELEQSSVVANAAMNRDRGFVGVNSYERDLAFELLDFLTARLQQNGVASWLDLCCGTGKALIETGEKLPPNADRREWKIVGVDLVNMFRPIPAGLSGVEFHTASLHAWSPRESFDLITCVHGLHYIGDKLDLLRRAASWLKPDGLLLAHLDLANVCLAGPVKRSQMLGNQFKRAGLEYHRRLHLLRCEGKREIDFPYEYVGADDQAGPNYSRQPAVNSHYRVR